MRRKRVKSLAEINELASLADRVRELAFRLEDILRSITPAGQQLKFHQLLECHEARFSHLDELHCARDVRNKLVHSEEVSDRSLLDAEVTLLRAIDEILEACPADLKREVRGTRPQQPAPSDLVETKPEPSPTARPDVAPPPVFAPIEPPPHELDHPEASKERAGPAAHAYLTPDAVPPRMPLWLRSGGIWFGLVGVCLALAFVAYHFRAQRPEPQVVLTANPQPEPPLPHVQSQPSAASNLPQVSAHPGTETPRRAPAVIQPAYSRDDEFRALINSALSLSSSQPNIALLLDSSVTDNAGSLADALHGFLASATKVHFVANLADTAALKRGGFFDVLYAGDSRLIAEAARLGHVDYILLGKATYSFRSQTSIDADLLTCALTLTCRLVDRNGTVVQSGSFSASGPGFTRSLALERAAENAAQQIKDRVLTSIP